MLFLSFLLLSIRTEKIGMLFASSFLLVISLTICSAQHWSYGLQPGGKRNAENMIESFQEITNELSKLGKLQHFDCNVPRQRPVFKSLKAALARLTEGENRPKKI
ncbi:progonadoliberin-1 [Zootoca vivipara]|uniref:progonadoliberin-1 n=1 Tax=Zootoca vivipara TaxID=8524 RepID=UPI00293BE6A3|nr:progonadoliberin-1 [Zootoca vivipara]